MQALNCWTRSFFIPEVHRRRGRRWKNEAVRKKVPQCETSTCVSSTPHTAVIKCGNAQQTLYSTEHGLYTRVFKTPLHCTHTHTQHTLPQLVLVRIVPLLQSVKQQLLIMPGTAPTGTKGDLDSPLVSPCLLSSFLEWMAGSVLPPSLEKEEFCTKQRKQMRIFQCKFHYILHF